MSKLDSRAVFTSNSDEWETPQAVFDELDEEFHFNLDPCATDKNRKCETYFTKDQNDLEKDWGGVQSFLQSTVQRHREVG